MHMTSTSTDGLEGCSCEFHFCFASIRKMVRIVSTFAHVKTEAVVNEQVASS